MSVQSIHNQTHFEIVAEKAQDAALAAWSSVTNADQQLPGIDCGGLCLTGPGTGCFSLEVQSRGVLAAVGVFILEVDRVVGNLRLAVEASERSPIHGELAKNNATEGLALLSIRIINAQKLLREAAGRLAEHHPASAVLYRQVAEDLIGVLSAVADVIGAKP